MANQPTKYRKFVVGAASAALVASAVAPVASAATFTDVADNNSHKEAIDALSDAGVIKGYADGTFQPNKTLTRSDVVKLMGKLLISEGYEIPKDAVSKPRFADLKPTSNKELLELAAVVRDNGVFVGKPDGTLDPTGDITRENMAIVIVRAFDSLNGTDLATYVKGQDFDKKVTDSGTAKAEARPAIDVLDFFEITNVAAFNPKNTTTRGQFASFLYRATQADFSKVDGGTVAPGVASVKGINSTTVEVTFKDAVTNLNSLNFTIEGLTVSNAAIKQGSNKTVVLTTAGQEGGKKYTVNLDGKSVGTFTGVSAVVPSQVKLNLDSLQGKVGQQSILSADIGVKTAGVPVTFNVKAADKTLNKDQVFEAVTDENGIATFSYTQYAAGADQVTAYASGAPAVRDITSVHWGVDTILTLEEDDKKGTSLSNGEGKKYKLTYKDPKTGKVKENQKINITFAENIDVAVNKLNDARVNGVEVYQTTNGQEREYQVTTDSKGQATFTVTGTNTKATPIAFIDDGGFYIEADAKNKKLDRTELQVKGKELTFGAVQADYTFEINRDGEEEAAVGKGNGRVYKVVVKDEKGNAAKNETVNVGFDEILDRVASTKTSAEFLVSDKNAGTYYDDDLEGDSKFVDSGRQQITLKLNSKGEGEFRIVSEDDRGYATPVVWVDTNSNNTSIPTLEEGEPSKKAAITYFAKEEIKGSKLKAYEFNTTNEVKNNRTLEGNRVVEFQFDVANQSGKTYKKSVAEFNATYQVSNTGSEPIYVWKNKADVGDIAKATKISNRGNDTFRFETENNKQVKLYVGNNGETTSVDVTVYGEAKATGSDEKLIGLTESKTSKASFRSTNELGYSYTGLVQKFDKNDKEIKFVGKDNLEYKPEFDANKVKYEDLRNNKTLKIDSQQFEDIVSGSLKDGKRTEVHYYKGTDGVITFQILDASATVADLTVKNVSRDVNVGGTPLKFTATDLATSNTGATLSLSGSASTSNASVATATVTGNELVVTPVAKGTADVTVNVTDGTYIKTATVKVTVKEAGATVTLGDITKTIKDNNFGSKVVGFNVNDLPADLRGATYSTVIDGVTYNFEVNEFAAERRTISVPSTIADSVINAAELKVVKP